MIKILKRDSNSVSIAIFYENYKSEKYNLDPSYQRKSVWNDEKQSFLIDSIMRNFPVPPIFLRQKIDYDTGKTTYEVIDGKQRLTSIIRFIEDEIPISTEEKPSDDVYDRCIAGLFFKEFEKDDDTKEYKKHFWRYHLSIEYIDSDSDELIQHIFDRLNRNGEPLNGQELRNASYNEKYFHKKVNEIALEKTWVGLLSKIDAARMENCEFIAELLFEVGENRPLHATQNEIDDYYMIYANKPNQEIDSIILKFNQIRDYLIDLEAGEYCQLGVSHFYGIWCFVAYCKDNNVPVDKIRKNFIEFYKLYKLRNYDNENILEYKRSMSSNTKSSNQREKRRDSLINFCLKNK